MTRSGGSMCALFVCAAVAAGCYRYSTVSEPAARSNVLVRFSPPRDLISESPAGVTMLLHSVRRLQGNVGSMRGDTLRLIAPGDYTGRDGNFLIDRGTSIRVVRDSSVAIKNVKLDLVQTGLVSFVIVSIGVVVYIFFSTLAAAES